MTFQNASFQKNQELTIETGHKVKLDKLIGDGYTAIVYTGWLKNNDSTDEKVIIKIAKPNEDAERLVSEEYETMRKLYSDIRINGRPVTPRVFGYGKVDKSSFIVMEFINAQPMMDLKDGKPLSEIVGLKAGTELFEFLDQLHKNCKMAYPDMKEENFYCTHDIQGANLRTIDLGGLEVCSELKNDPRYERDVYRAAQYFFKLFAGYSLRTSWNYELEENPVTPINSLTDLSLGTKNLLINLLARDAKFRIKDAHDIKVQIETLLKFWTQPSESLIKIATTIIEMAKSKSQEELESKATLVDRASNVMDIYLRRFPERKTDAEGVCKQANDLDKEVSLLNRALVNIKTKNYSEARNLLSKGEETSITPEIFRRLIYLLDDLANVDPEYLSPLLEIYESLMASIKDFPESVAKVCADQKERYPNTNCFSLIIEDLNYVNNVEAADKFELQQAYEQSITALKNARTNLDRLPDKAKIVRDNHESIDLRIFNLEKKLESSKRLDETTLVSDTIIKEAIEKQDVNELVSKIVYQSRYGEFTSELDAKIATFLKALLENDYIEQANRLAQVVKFLPEHSQELLSLSNVTQLCSGCIKSLSGSSDFMIYSAIKKLVDLNSPLGLAFAKQYLSTAVKNEQIGDNDELLQQFCLLADLVNCKELKEEIQQQIDLITEHKSSSIIHRLEEIEFSLNLETPWQIQFEQSLQLLQTKSIAGIIAFIEDTRSRLEVLENQLSQIEAVDKLDGNLVTRFNRIREELTKLKKVLATLEEGKSQNVNDLELQQNEFSTEWEKFYSDNLSSFSFKNPQLDSLKANELFSQLLQYYKHAILLSMRAQDSSIFQKYGGQIFSAMDCLRVLPIDSIREQFSNETSLESQEILSQIDQKYYKGDILGALEILESISPLAQLSLEVQKRRENLIRSYAYELQLKEKIQKMDYMTYDVDVLQLILKNKEIHLPIEVLEKYRIRDLLESQLVVYYSESKRFNISMKSLADDSADRGLIGFKQCVEKLVKIESALLAISENKDSGI